ncbi:MAG TPA: HEAT repeat domain-containing protein, partial [Vicinamibacterales bacterium]|nr:HEAT repeat domain-containing protein [Vicinamibacterales bacterium]
MKRALLPLAFVLLAAPGLVSQTPRRPPLASADIDAITTLVMLEDTRTFDQEKLAALLKSAHPEVRRRAALAIGRIGYPRAQNATDAQSAVTTQARALLVTARGDSNVEVAGTVAFSTGQLKDADAVSWLGGLLSTPATAAPVAREAACSLGKIRSPEARTVLAKYLADAPATAAPDVVGEALLSSGRFTGPGDIAPIVKWSTAKNDEVRWRATWALFRLRDPAGAEPLLRLSEDPSAEVRFWAVRGLASIDSVPAEMKTRESARLRAAVKDSDRRVRTEALRALATYQDDASFEVVLAALESPDTWLSVSAAEAMGR